MSSIFLIVLGVAVISYYFLIYIPQKDLSSQTEQNQLATKIRCQQDGKKFIDSKFDSTSLISLEWFAYSADLNTCLTDVIVQNEAGLLHHIYDIYSGNTLASLDVFQGKDYGDLHNFVVTEDKYFPSSIYKIN